MRLFETLLVSSVLLDAINQMVSSFKEWRNKENRYISSNSPQNLLLIVSFVLFVIHFFLEGIRWQLYYLYAYLFFALIVIGTPCSSEPHTNNTSYPELLLYLAKISAGIYTPAKCPI